MDTSLERKQRNLALSAELGKRLRAIRRKKKIRQVDVAESMGFGRPLVSKIEHGQRELSAVEVPRYAEAIHVDPDVLWDEIKRITFEYDSSQQE